VIAHQKLKEYFEENLTSDKLNEFQSILMNPTTEVYTAIFATNSICQMLKKFLFFQIYQNIQLFFDSNWTLFTQDNKNILCKLMLEETVHIIYYREPFYAYI